MVPALMSITVAPAAKHSFSGDTVWANYDWPGIGSVLYPGGAGKPVGPGGATFDAPAGGLSVNVTATNITVTFTGAWNFNTTSPKTVDGIAVTDPLATITGASLASTNISGYTGSPAQLFFDNHDVYISFPSAGFSSLNNGATVSVNVQFATSPTAGPYAIPAGSTEQFTATGHYSDSSTQDLTNSVTVGRYSWRGDDQPYGLGHRRSARHEIHHRHLRRRARLRDAHSTGAAVDRGDAHISFYFRDKHPAVHCYRDLFGLDHAGSHQFRDLGFLGAGRRHHWHHHRLGRWRSPRHDDDLSNPGRGGGEHRADCESGRAR